MADDKNFLILIEKISEIGERTVRMEVEQKNMKEDLEEVKKQDQIQNQLLSEHIRGVETAHARLDNEIDLRRSMELEAISLSKRVDKLEESPKFRASLKQYIIVIGSIAGAIVAILKLLQVFGV